MQLHVCIFNNKNSYVGVANIYMSIIGCYLRIHYLERLIKYHSDNLGFNWPTAKFA